MKVYVVGTSVEFEGGTILAAFDSYEAAERFAEQHRLAARYVPDDLIYNVDELTVNEPAEQVRNSYLNRRGWVRP